MSDQSWSKKKIIQTSALFAFLVIIPLGSWFYLRKGLDYRLDAMAELDSLAVLPTFEWVDQSGETFKTESLDKHLLIGGILPEGAERAAYVERLGRIHNQFDKRPDVMFLTLVPEGEEEELSRQFDILDPVQWKWIGLSDTEIQAFADHYQMNENGNASQWLTLTDGKGVLRKHYDYEEDQQMARLIEHMAMLLPRGVPRKTEKQR